MDFLYEDLGIDRFGVPDASYWRGRRPLTPRWQPGVAPAVRTIDFRGTDFRLQYQRSTWGAFDYGEICGTEAFMAGAWSYSDFDSGESGSGALAITFEFKTTTVGSTTTYEVKRHETITGDPILPSAPVGLHIKTAEGGQYSIVDINGAGDEVERRVGQLILTGPVRSGFLLTQAKEWAGQSEDFREATKDGNYYAYRTGSEGGWHAVASYGHARHSGDITADEGGYEGHSGGYSVFIDLEKRRNMPVLRDEGVTEATGNGLYRNGSASWSYGKEITDYPWRDDYGTYGLEGKGREKAFSAVGWRPMFPPATGALAGIPQQIARNQFVSADGRRYRVTVQAGNADGEDWDAVDTVNVEVSRDAPGEYEFDRDTIIAAGGASEVRVTSIELFSGGGYLANSVYPETHFLIGTEVLIPGMLLFAETKFRHGSRWGFPDPDGSEKYYAERRLVKHASLR